MTPARLRDTRNDPHCPCWLSADSVDTCVAMSDCSAARPQRRGIPSATMLVARSRHRSGSYCKAISAAPALSGKTHTLKPAAKSP
jgi:hypothetical protein